MLSRAVSGEVAEGTIAAGLTTLQNDFPDLEVGSYPYFHEGRPGVSVVVRGTEAVQLDAAAERLRALMRELGATPVDQS